MPVLNELSRWFLNRVARSSACVTIVGVELGEGMRAVRIPPQDDGWLGFDLAEVMSAVGDRADLRWVLRWASFNGDVSAVWSDGVDGVEADSRSVDGIAMTWEQMRRLASTCTQIVDGEFSGYQEARLRMSLEVIDSSYWVVAADDPRALASVRSAFHGVTDDPQQLA